MSQQHSSILLLTIILLLNIQSTFSQCIDGKPFQEKFQNRSTIPLHECNAFCTTRWIVYDWLDIQNRVGIWIVPLFVLIGSFHFAPLRPFSVALDAIHLMVDPISSIYNLLTKLAAQQEIYRRCQTSRLPEWAKNPVAIILLAAEDWEPYFVSISSNDDQDLAAKVSGSMISKLSEFERLLEEDESIMREQRVNAIQSAAKELSDSRINGLGKMIIGTTNYVVTLINAFANVIRGNFNNRTGHSMAFGVLWTFLLVLVCLSSVLGSFITKRSARTALERLQRHLNQLSPKNDSDQKFGAAETLPEHRNFPFQAKLLDTTVFAVQDDEERLAFIKKKMNQEMFPFHILEGKDINEIHRSLEWIGMNYPATPSLFCPSSQKKFLAIISTLPVFLPTASACWISVTNPTFGIGCRSIEQLAFLLGWLISAILTVFFRRRFSGKQHLDLMRIKDTSIGLAMGSNFCLGFIGWYNSCFCWSSWFSNWRAPYIVVDPTSTIERLAKTTWPKLCFTTVGLQLIFISLVYIWFSKGARLYSMSDEEHEKWRRADLMTCRRGTWVMTHITVTDQTV